MYAMIETGGKQFKAAPGQSISVERLDAEKGSEVRFEKVLAVVKESGAVFGTPYIENASVSAEVVGAGKGKKVAVYKQKPRKGMRRLRGHRQHFTTLIIKEILGV